MEYKQVIVIRTDLNMSQGKKVAQGAHGVGKCIHMILSDNRFVDPPVEFPESIRSQLNYRKIDARDQIQHEWRMWYNEWNNSLYKKITLKVVSESELFDLALKAFNDVLPVFLVKDAGLTEIPANTYTAIVIGPAPVDRINAITGKLKTL